MLFLCPVWVNCRYPGTVSLVSAGYEEWGFFADPPIGLCSDNNFSPNIDRVVGESAV